MTKLSWLAWLLACVGLLAVQVMEYIAAGNPLGYFIFVTCALLVLIVTAGWVALDEFSDDD